MKFKKVRITVSKLAFSLKLLYVLVIVFAVVIFSLLSGFLYKNFYQTITQSQKIIILRQEVAPDTIDIERINQILKALDQKATTTNEISNLEINNPFNPVPTTPTASSTSTTN